MKNKTFQIIRFYNGSQQHFDTIANEFKTSNDRFDGEFSATLLEASKILRSIDARKTNCHTLPKLMSR